MRKSGLRYILSSDNQKHRVVINHKQHPGEFEGASVAYAGRFNFRFYYEKMLNSETGKCGL